MDIRRMLRSRAFYLAAFLAALSLIAGTPFWDLDFKRPLAAGTFLELLKTAFSGDSVLFLLPITAVLPCSDAYIRERQSGFLRLFALRRSKREYIQDKVLAAGVSGALVWALSCAVVLFLYFLIFFGLEQKGAVSGESVKELLLALLRTALAAGIFSQLGALFAALSESVYLALGIPFVLFYLPVILRERYFEDIYWVDPREWLLAKEDWGAGQTGLYLLLVCALLAVSICHFAALDWRMEEI